MTKTEKILLFGSLMIIELKLGSTNELFPEIAVLIVAIITAFMIINLTFED